MGENRRAGERAEARRAVGFWYRMGLALADAQPPHAYAHAYDLGRRMAALRRPARPPSGRLGSAGVGEDPSRGVADSGAGRPCIPLGMVEEGKPCSATRGGR